MPAKRTKPMATARPWRAKCELSWPADPTARDRLRAGEKLTPEERGDRVSVAQGATLSGVPDDIMEALLRDGVIEQFDPEEVDQRDPAGLPRRARAEEGSSDG